MYFLAYPRGTLWSRFEVGHRHTSFIAGSQPCDRTSKSDTEFKTRDIRANRGMTGTAMVIVEDCDSLFVG